jgi:murein DD-endopeptidase MepM/ murein hydrolase activator NlpD
MFQSNAMNAPRERQPVVVLMLVAMLAACGGSGSGGAGPGAQADFCDSQPFAPANQSAYVLPYSVGATFTMFQGNCPANPAWGHNGMFAYDFDLPMGTPVRASREGTVTWTNEQFADNDHIPGHENLVVIQHADGTVIRYAHLMQNGVEVTQGATVRPGDLLGFSGNSGNSSGPHLHIDLLSNGTNFSKSNTLPLTFRNAGGRTEPSGELIQDERYTALAFP